MEKRERCYVLKAESAKKAKKVVDILENEFHIEEQSKDNWNKRPNYSLGCANLDKSRSIYLSKISDTTWAELVKRFSLNVCYVSAQVMSV